MMSVLQFTQHALNDLEVIPKNIAQRIVLKLEFYLSTNNPMRFAKALSGPLQGFSRFRIGDYRVIFEQNASGKIVIYTILRIKHRREIYE
ncbi:MAG: Plasmid stabilization system [Candidatus Uhrbacteria bacterium GW2011_GWF2_41_16]|jgi:mRNA interferase RelE/StbE|uniref:Plasmid stabilization system n=2 Tax=Candidatus Uhriibacteriota TaxID=1752732 RepID=A0A0G0XL54_9BACT|nr:MAG: Plasmid stabilization system [Candidatus Uhrbacteria bacterium GW2011_GWC2_41_11]KKR97520.1 MAG: Plasmid stabilization system [Candidatus Uhrbacteria bacterium GW2011_GWF2_41_16]HBP00021.1 type II toxin-antitoxin system mRNA interferase toxin, RelE/StbE family [Candidatus Uhrbacteria bacterium]